MKQMPNKNTLQTAGALDGNGDPFKGAASFTLGHRIYRLLWNIAWRMLFSWTPPALRRWRIMLLNLFGAKIHSTAQVYGSAKIWYPKNLHMSKYSSIGPDVICYSMGDIKIGEYTVISQRAHLCTGTHDLRNKNFQIYAKPITIEKNVWVCAEAFVGPGVSIAEGAVLAARGAAFKNLEAWCIYRGNPAEKIGERLSFIRK